MTLELDELERASLLALVGLAVSVMQNNEQHGREFIKALSQEGMEAICKALVEKISGEVADADAD